VLYFCVDRFLKSPDAAQSAELLKLTTNYDRGTFLERGGYTSLPGSAATNWAVGRACGDLLAAAAKLGGRQSLYVNGGATYHFVSANDNASSRGRSGTKKQMNTRVIMSKSNDKKTKASKSKPKATGRPTNRHKASPQRPLCRSAKSSALS
jgi:hypothetical protein